MHTLEPCLGSYLQGAVDENPLGVHEMLHRPRVLALSDVENRAKEHLEAALQIGFRALVDLMRQILTDQGVNQQVREGEGRFRDGAKNRPEILFQQLHLVLIVLHGDDLLQLRAEGCVALITRHRQGAGRQSVGTN